MQVAQLHKANVGVGVVELGEEGSDALGSLTTVFRHVDGCREVGDLVSRSRKRHAEGCKDANKYLWLDARHFQRLD
jgi:hypothetical protein